LIWRCNTGTFEKIIAALGQVADNVWAALLFLLAGVLAFFAHLTGDEKLFQFAGSVTMTAAALFHANKGPKES